MLAGVYCLAVFFDDAVANLVDDLIYIMKAGFRTIPGIGHGAVFAGIQFIQEELSFYGIEFFCCNALHIVQHILRHCINFIILIEVSGNELPCLLFADVDAVQPGHFLRKPVRCFADMVPIGAGAVYRPLESGLLRLMFQNPFGQRAPADIAQAYH